MAQEKNSIVERLQAFAWGTVLVVAAFTFAVPMWTLLVLGLAWVAQTFLWLVEAFMRWPFSKNVITGSLMLLIYRAVLKRKAKKQKGKEQKKVRRSIVPGQLARDFAGNAIPRPVTNRIRRRPDSGGPGTGGGISS